ncbi:MAG: secondary thiamine-phosphate synthase enzyme YjbQ [Candidatus Nitrospinota bacterium M3_3B_026]
MTVTTSSFSLGTQGFSDIIDITGEVERAVKESGARSGSVLVFVPGSTAGITTIEYESGAVSDLEAAIDRLVPRNIHYSHDARWGDGNGFSHVRAALMGASFTAPFDNGRLLTGTWQQIVLVDFDNRPRRRDVIVQVQGE